MKKIAFICVHNSCRSQMADADWERIRNQLQEDIKNYYSEMGGI